MRELYMKSGQGFLLVFSITSLSSLTELQELRDQIVRIKDDPLIPLVIVGNKCDLEEDRAVSRARAFSVSSSWNNAPYYETSARARRNVDEAFVDLCRQIIRKDTINAKDAAALDKDLMSVGAFSIDQLMELAGLSVSQALYKVHPLSSGKNILVACGPGNNGGDGLVAARHLFHYGYTPTIFYPKPTKSEIYERLATQLRNLGVPFTEDFEGSLQESHHVIDAIFGFSFSGQVRDPFRSVISALESTKVPVLAVDAPSSWSIEDGPPKEGPGAKFMPQTLVSLTAPKPLVRRFGGRHFMGGRFLPPSVAEKYGLDYPTYPGVDQIVEEESEIGEKKGQSEKLAERHL
ncbi:uncharacterized protein KY384_000493 [Bacidia gigantensis]|uniref:uncharacterized protein n=1 Tax=Bacidia gigantensis TaxID=2732470 RepID=UPI001D0424F6|nr:uncharacterized protein KY384_000493 [Bacidia gigantensis]KAG8525733.1 hypothetical protein KY384_000493 [Bacidia gigantensis]